MTATSTSLACKNSIAWPAVAQGPTTIAPASQLIGDAHRNQRLVFDQQDFDIANFCAPLQCNLQNAERALVHRTRKFRPAFREHAGKCGLLLRCRVLMLRMLTANGLRSR